MRRHLPGLRPIDNRPRPADPRRLLPGASRESHLSRLQRQAVSRGSSFLSIEPRQFSASRFSARLYCTSKALWKLSWFLRDFGYDADLLGHDQIDDKALAGLQGVVKISYTNLNGRSYLNLDGFAPATNWQDFQLEKAG